MFLKKILLVATCLLFPSSALAGHIDLAWSANPEPDVAGYIAHYGTLSGEYTKSLDLGKVTSARITGLLEDTEYFFVLTAYDVYYNESDFSGEVSGYAVPGDDPGDGISARGRKSLVAGCFISTSTQKLFEINNQPKIASH